MHYNALLCNFNFTISLKFYFVLRNNMSKIQLIIIAACIIKASCYGGRRQTTKATSKLFFPPELQMPNQTKVPNLRIPNDKFCAKMQLKPSQHYMVLPWWYNYCAQTYENIERKYQDTPYNVAMYRRVLDQIHSYKKMKKLQQRALDKIKMEA